jgi:hypothetical protein
MTPRPTIHSFTGQRQPARRPAPTRVAKCQHSSLQVMVGQPPGPPRSAIVRPTVGHRRAAAARPCGLGARPRPVRDEGGNASGNCPKNKERVSWCSFFLLCIQVEAPRVQPKLSEPFLGFTQTAEIWNSRACMIGLIGTFIVELVTTFEALLLFLLEFRSQCSMDRLLNF